MTSVHDFTVRTIDGNELALASLAGKVLLVVNVASECGLTPQYEALEALYREKRDEGLVVLGFPCNQFGAQEPGTEAEIASFCSKNYGVTFPLFAKIDVNGDARAPLYAYLTSLAVGPEGAGDLKWNFGKFLVNKDGSVRARFAPTVKPTNAALRTAIEDALTG